MRWKRVVEWALFFYLAPGEDQICRYLVRPESMIDIRVALLAAGNLAPPSVLPQRDVPDRYYVTAREDARNDFSRRYGPVLSPLALERHDR